MTPPQPPFRGRLGVITTSFPRYPGDFAGSFVYHMAEAFAHIGYAIDVVTPAAPPNAAVPSPFTAVSAPWLAVHPVRYMFPPSLQRLCYGSGTPENLSRHPLNGGLILPLVYTGTG